MHASKPIGDISISQMSYCLNAELIALTWACVDLVTVGQLQMRIMLLVRW